MKLLAAILALSAAVMAAPAPEVAADEPPNFVMDSKACACANDEGRWRVDDLCTQNFGWPTYEYPDAWCYRHSPSAPEMTTVFTEDRCASFYPGSGYTKQTCRNIKLCKNWPDLPEMGDLWVDCENHGSPGKIE
ncbi:hypothetical protein PG990_015299 [Apiospora arundinis]